MSAALKLAHAVKSRSYAAIARELEMTPQTIGYWFAGRHPVPERKRAALERAMRATVDWAAYDAERGAPKAEQPQTPEKPPTEALKPLPAPTQPKPQARPPVAAPAAIPARPRPSGGFLSSIFD